MEQWNQLVEFARRIRVHSLHMVYRARSSHIGSCLSVADLLAVLYGSVLRVDPGNPSWNARDRLLMSKGHASAALYAALAERGFFPSDWLETFYQNGTRLAGHVTHTGVPGVEASTGSLGHGLSLACGMALAGKWEAQSYRVFCLLSDGECDEGSVWEAALFAAHHRLDNLVAVVDYNKIQSLGRVEEVLGLEPFAAKWESFGWALREIDGHDLGAIQESCGGVPFSSGRPSCILAHTVKGKGVAFMEDKLLWHYRSPNEEEFRLALVGFGEVP